MNPLTLRLDSLLLSRRLASGTCLVSPVATARFVAHGTEWQASEDLRLFLTELLSRVSPEEVARHALPEGVELTSVRVTLPRDELPRRVRVKVPIQVYCVVVPDGLDRWVHVIALDHTIHLRRDESLDLAVAHEVERLVGALELDPEAWLRLLPPRSVALLPARIEVERTERLPPGRVTSLRKLWQQQRRTRDAEVLLNSVARPLHHHIVRKAPPLTARGTELRQLSAILEGKTRLSVLLQGPALAGRSALVLQWFRERLRREPTARLYATSAAQLIAGMSGLGAWEERLRRVMEAAEHLDAVLWFDAMGDLFADRASGQVDLPAALKPYLEDGRVRVVGELRTDLLDLAERRNGAFLACMSRLTVEPFDAPRTAEALRAHLAFEHAQRDQERPTLRDDAVDALVDLAERYLPYQSFPGKAFKLYETLRTQFAQGPTAGSDVADTEGTAPRVLGPDAVYEGFSLQSGIPAFLLRTRSPLERSDVIARLATRVVGQSDAVARVAEVVMVVKAQLQPQGRPLAVLLFVGPTGVGKTELARSLAALLFGSETRLVRFDMSEFNDPEAADRLLRGTDGSEGLLTRRVREQPFCVLLLDEVEKAHPAVFDLLLQVLGEGRLTDGRGRTAFFHNAIVIMTSNLGVASHRDAAGFSAAADVGRHYVREVERTFRPEFVNRLDRVVAFGTLRPEEVRQVAAMAVGRIASRRRIARDGASLTVSPAALDRLASDGYSARYGARALRRHLEDHLVSPIAQALSALAAERGNLLHLDVTLADETPVPPSGARVSRGFPVGALRGVAHFAAASDLGRSEAAVERLSGARRRVDACMALPRVEALREQLEYLQTQLDYGTDAPVTDEDRRTAAERGALQTEYHRLDGVWQGLQGAREEINLLEDIGLLATLEGAPASELLSDAERALARFDRVLCQALLVQERRRDAATLRVTDLDGSAGLHRWVVPLVESAGARGWEVAIHFDGAAVAVDGVWPTGHRWGPANDLEEACELLMQRERDPASVLVRVRGPWAGVLLALEQGPHRHMVDGVEARFDVRFLGMCWDLPEPAWDHKAIVPEGPQALEKKGREPLVRLVTSSSEGRKVKVRKWPPSPEPDAGYFDGLEGYALRELMPFETDEDDRDRDELFVGPLDLGFATAGVP